MPGSSHPGQRFPSDPGETPAAPCSGPSGSRERAAGNPMRQKVLPHVSKPPVHRAGFGPYPGGEAGPNRGRFGMIPCVKTGKPSREAMWPCPAAVSMRQGWRLTLRRKRPRLTLSGRIFHVTACLPFSAVWPPHLAGLSGTRQRRKGSPALQRSPGTFATWGRRTLHPHKPGALSGRIPCLLQAGRHPVPFQRRDLSHFPHCLQAGRRDTAAGPSL